MLPMLKQKTGTPSARHVCLNMNAHVLRSNLYTPLHLAAETGDADIVNVLLDSGSNVLASNTCDCPVASVSDALLF